MTVHGQRENLSIAAETEYPLPGMWSITYHRINDGVKTTYAWDGAGN